MQTVLTRTGDKLQTNEGLKDKLAFLTAYKYLARTFGSIQMDSGFCASPSHDTNHVFFTQNKALL